MELFPTTSTPGISRRFTRRSGLCFFGGIHLQEFYPGLDFNRLWKFSTRKFHLRLALKAILLGEVLAFRLPLNIRGGLLSDIYLTFLCICVL